MRMRKGAMRETKKSFLKNLKIARRALSDAIVEGMFLPPSEQQNKVFDAFTIVSDTINELEKKTTKGVPK